jgi:protein required for attachment to host cells
MKENNIITQKQYDALKKKPQNKMTDKDAQRLKDFEDSLSGQEICEKELSETMEQMANENNANTKSEKNSSKPKSNKNFESTVKERNKLATDTKEELEHEEIEEDTNRGKSSNSFFYVGLGVIGVGLALSWWLNTSKKEDLEVPQTKEEEQKAEEIGTNQDFLN